MIIAKQKFINYAQRVIFLCSDCYVSMWTISWYMLDINLIFKDLFLNQNLPFNRKKEGTIFVLSVQIYMLLTQDYST